MYSTNAVLHPAPAIVMLRRSLKDLLKISVRVMGLLNKINDLANRC